MDDRERAYISDIPAEAVEHVIATHENGSKQRAEYYVGESLAGIRQFDTKGELEGEWPYRDGGLHGTVYRWDTPGELLSAEPYESGVPHGTVRQWSESGALIGTYTMERGTGLDLWWQDWPDGSVELSEAFFMKDGRSHGWEWWWSSRDQLWQERHWHEGEKHGIEREWNLQGGLSRGFPRYWVHNERRTKAQYQKAAATDSTLPPFRIEENHPVRVFPPEVARHLNPENEPGKPERSET